MAVTHKILTGPILILDLDIYDDSFYINYLNIVASTSQLQIKQRSTLSNYLILFQQKTETERKVAKDKRRMDMHAREELQLD